MAAGREGSRAAEEGPKRAVRKGLKRVDRAERGNHKGSDYPMR